MVYRGELSSGAGASAGAGIGDSDGDGDGDGGGAWLVSRIGEGKEENQPSSWLLSSSAWGYCRISTLPFVWWTLRLAWWCWREDVKGMMMVVRGKMNVGWYEKERIGG